MSLPEPSFIDRDPVAITAELKASWEATTGKTLYPGQVESLLIDLIAYRETLVRIGIQEAAKQNLVSYARAPMLDYLGELVGTYRLDDETDDHLRERIKLAPESFSTAGSRMSYIYHSFSADASIVDVAVISPTPGTVNIYPLTENGNPDAGIISAVTSACSGETVRPLCDTVVVLSPVKKDFVINVQIIMFDWAVDATALDLVNTALADYAANQKSLLGRDVILTQIIAAVNSVYGVYKTELVSPVADITNAANEWSNCTGISVTITGYNNG